MNNVSPIDIAHTPLTLDRPYTLQRSRKRRGEGLPLHAHDEAQLTFAASGALQIYTAEGRWLVPPQLAVWAPAGLPHRIEILTDAELWILHHRPLATEARAPALRLDRAFALRVTPLLRALLAAAFAAEHGARKGRSDRGANAPRADRDGRRPPPSCRCPPARVARRVVDLALDDPLQPAGRGRAGLARSYLRPYPQPPVPAGGRGSPSRPGGSGRGSCTPWTVWPGATRSPGWRPTVASPAPPPSPAPSAK